MANEPKQPKRTKQRTEEDNSGSREPSGFEGRSPNPFVWRSKRHRRGEGGAPALRWPWQNKDEF
jgi:hypothetical protein